MEASNPTKGTARAARAAMALAALALCVPCQSRAQSWISRYDVALKQAEKNGVPMLVLFSGDTDKSVRANPFLASKEFKNFARDGLACLKVEIKYSLSQNGPAYVPTIPSNEEAVKLLPAGYDKYCLYRPSDGRVRDDIISQTPGPESRWPGIMADIRLFCGKSPLPGWSENFMAALKKAEDDGKILYMLFQDAEGGFSGDRVHFSDEFNAFGRENLVPLLVLFKKSGDSIMSAVQNGNQEVLDIFGADGKTGILHPKLIDPKSGICKSLSVRNGPGDVTAAARALKAGENVITDARGLKWICDIDAGIKEAMEAGKKIIVGFCRDEDGLETDEAWARDGARAYTLVALFPPVTIYDTGMRKAKFESLREEFKSNPGTACLYDPQTRNCVRISAAPNSKAFAAELEKAERIINQ